MLALAGLCWPDELSLKESAMLSLLGVLAVVGLLMALGLKICMYLYGAGALGHHAISRSRRGRTLPINPETEEAIAEAEYVTSMIRSLER
jgi:hypothetical protein